MPTQIESGGRGLYGKVYLFSGYGPGATYSARIWSDAGVDVWHDTDSSPDAVYEKMRAAAKAMNKPVDLYRFGSNEISENVGDLPF